MRLFHEASIKSISLEKFGSEVENDRDIWRNGVKADKIELGGIIVPQGSIPRQSVYRKLRKAWLLLLSFAVLHYVYLGTFLPRYSIRSHQTPNLHFSTATGTRTTPVGLFIDRYNIWHIYLQYTPSPMRVRDFSSWGHAVSSDLYTWSMQPTVLQCRDANIQGGSVLIDANNTSGLFPDQTDGVVAIYTQHSWVTGTRELASAYSTDGGYTFIKYPKGLRFQSPAGNQGLLEPKIVWYEQTSQWVMTAVTETTPTAIGIYTSPNLIDWIAASEFTNQDLKHLGHRFEYPNLVPIPRINSTGAKDPNLPTVPGGTLHDYGDYILVSSSTGSPLHGGSVTRYFPGKFNGTHFQPINNRTDRYIDFGPDNYASQFFFGLSSKMPVVSLGMASNLQYTLSPSDRTRRLDYTSTFTSPREGYLIPGPGEGDLSYFSRPFGLEDLRDGILANFSRPHLVDSSVSYNGSEAVLVEAKFEMQPPNDEEVDLNLDFIFKSRKSSEKILCTIIFKTWTADFGCDRSLAGLKSAIDNSPLDQMSALQVRPLLPFHNPAVRRWEIQAIMDGYILETFLNKGVKAGTIIISPTVLMDSVNFQSSKIPDWATLSMTVQKLRPATST